MIVKRASIMGFCMGVRQAVEKAEEVLQFHSDTRVYTIGPLIHNRLCIEDLREKGIRMVSSPGEVDGGVVIVRAHGIPPSLREQLEARGAEIIDATCPRVHRSQHFVKEFSDNNYHIVIAGDKDHGEIKGIAGFAVHYDIVQDEKEAEALVRENKLPEKIMVIGQTTLNQDEYDRICAVIRNAYPEAVVRNSICPATRQRQAALVSMADEVDAFVIVGGKNSANTSRLYRTAVQTGKPAWHVEEASELPQEIAQYAVVGLSAGASTPDRTVDEVEERLKQL